MGSSTDKTPKWIEVGRSTTSPVTNTQRKEVHLDEYYVVIGFEVNNLQAFVDDTQDLAMDYGHAFFYVVKNHVVTRFFSFGPTGAGKVGWFDQGNIISPNKYDTGAMFKDGYQNARPGTPDYGISERVKAFKIPLTLKQGRLLETETDAVRARIISKQQKYTAYMNDTCAETARDILGEAGIATPSGSGAVKHSDMINWPVAYVVNPYMWYHNFKKAGKKEISYMPPGIPDEDWRPKIGEKDPIFKVQ